MEEAGGEGLRSDGGEPWLNIFGAEAEGDGAEVDDAADDCRDIFSGASNRLVGISGVVFRIPASVAQVENIPKFALEPAVEELVVRATLFKELKVL